MSETLDKAYLEYSQITKARTEREKSLASQVRWLIEYGGAMRQSFNGGRTADNWDKQVKTAFKALEDVNL